MKISKLFLLILFFVATPSLFTMGAIFAADNQTTETAKDNEQVNGAEQTEKTNLETITVTAKRYEESQLKTPSFSTVIDTEEMARLGGSNAYETLKRTGGVNFTSHLPFGMHMGNMSSSIGFRGLKNGELVLLNGSPMTDPSYGYYDIDMIPSSFLERIEVVKGSGSALYGSQAMTGVINLGLKKPGTPAYGGEVSGGNRGAVSSSASYRNETLVIAGHYSRGDQLTDLRKYYSATSPYNTSVLAWDRAASLVSFRPWNPLTLTYMYNYLDSGWNRDYYTKKTSNYEVLETSNRHYMMAEFKNDAAEISSFITYNHFVRDYEYAAAGKPNATYDTSNYTAGANAQKIFQLENTIFLGGLNYYYENQDEDNQTVSGSSSSGYSFTQQVMDHDRHQAALFVTADHELTDRFIVSGGVRFVGVWETDEGNENYYEPVPQVQALYRTNENNSIYASVGRAFKVPAFGQMYIDRSNYAPNPDLKPEYGWTYEIGWKWEYEKFSGTIAGFFMNYEDKLATRYMDDLGKYQYQNMDDFQSTGVEWQFNYRCLDNVYLHLAGYAADPWEESNGEKSQAGPKLQIAPGIEYRTDQFSVGLNAEMYYQRERGLDDYTKLNLTAAYNVNSRVKLKLNIDNLLDDRDQMIYGNMSPSANTKYASYEPGIIAMAGVEVSFH